MQLTPPPKKSHPPSVTSADVCGFWYLCGLVSNLHGSSGATICPVISKGQSSSFQALREALRCCKCVCVFWGGQVEGSDVTPQDHVTARGCKLFTLVGLGGGVAGSPAGAFAGLPNWLNRGKLWLWPTSFFWIWPPHPLKEQGQRSSQAGELHHPSFKTSGLEDSLFKVV